MCCPLDVELDNGNVYQPDVFFISKDNQSIIREKVKGTPDFIAEVLSGNRNHDLKEKKENYGKHGVKEYWLIDPDNKSVSKLENKNGQMIEIETVSNTGDVKSKVIQGFTISLAQLFEDIDL